jgi:hypothetical protein
MVFRGTHRYGFCASLHSAGGSPPSRPGRRKMVDHRDDTKHGFR